MTTSPGKYNFYLYPGATFTKTLVWQDENNALINLTGYMARMQMRETVGAATPFLTLTTENGGITLGGSAGTINLLVSATDTETVTVTQGVYDLQLIAPDGVTVTRLLEGIVFIDPGVTQ